MRTFPEYSGVMANWPKVQAVAGIPLTLAALRPEYRLVVGSNAIDSNAIQVHQALERVDAGQYFEAIFTFHELQAKKPDLAFFKALELRCSTQPDRTIMIGDDWQADCLGAHLAGWRSIWYNPGHLTCPGHIPLHDIEISHMEQLPQALASPPLPGWETCLSWLLAAGAPHNLLLHVQTVAAIGYQLALWMRSAGHPVDPILVHRGGLLHDISKVEAREAHRQGKTDSDHNQLGAQRLLNLKQPVLAEITRRHQLNTILEEQTAPRTTEEILVYFADKLANGSQLVTPEERVAILAHRYPEFSTEIQTALRPLLQLQSELCEKMKLSETELIPRIKKALSGKKF